MKWLLLIHWAYSLYCTLYKRCFNTVWPVIMAMSISVMFGAWSDCQLLPGVANLQLFSLPLVWCVWINVMFLGHWRSFWKYNVLSCVWMVWLCEFELTYQLHCSPFIVIICMVLFICEILVFHSQFFNCVQCLYDCPLNGVTTCIMAISTGTMNIKGPQCTLKI